MPEKIGPMPDLKSLQKLFGGTIILVALAFLLLAITLFTTIGVKGITGEEVGIKLNKISGKIEVINQPGMHIYNGITSHFYILDKTIQTLPMTGEDALKVKTVDGSDVFVELKVQYKLDPSMADIVLNTSGKEDAYKEKWTRDYVRSFARNYLGELTTEQFYNAGLRDERIRNAEDMLNKELNQYGIVIDDVVIPMKPRFYAEYEEMIKKKKLADQAVLEEQSKASAAKQKQETLLVEEQNKMNVAVKDFEGKMEQLVIEAKAKSEQAKRTADAYHEKVTVGAEATLYELTQKAEATLATKKAEAEGIEAMKTALEGEGGRNMVKMEYARKLADILISGQPFSIQSDTERFEHHSAEPTATSASTAAAE